MAQSDDSPTGPDFGRGVPLSEIPSTGVLAGHVDGTPVLLARLDDGIHAIGGACTHYGGPLGEGLRVGGVIRCPWHHACFDLRTGRALHAPAIAALSTWRVEMVDEMVFVRDEASAGQAAPTVRGEHPGRIVIVGGGAAGYAAAVRLRDLGFAGTLTMLSADDDAPYDRPNLSKDYLAGTAPEDWIPLQGHDFYEERRIDLRRGCEVTAIDAAERQLTTSTGECVAYDALLLATGAEPRRLPVPGFDLPNVFLLRSLADCRAIIAACGSAKSVALVGGGFIGMEAAGALRARGLEVHVIDLEKVPMARALGSEVGGFIAGLHRERGVVFHLGIGSKGFDGRQLLLEDGTRIEADFVIVGAGVAPRTKLAADAGLAIDHGILVDEMLRTSAAGIFAVGDVARYPYRDELVRVEHWVHAQRQGQAAAANLLGAGTPFTDVPFFWTHHYGIDVRSTGYAAGWDDIRIDGDLTARDFTARYLREGRLVAAVTVGRDLENLRIEAELEQANAGTAA